MAEKLITMLVTLTLVAAVATGCGRRSGLEPPSRAAVESDGTAQTDQADAEETKPDRPFILDGLIE